MTTNNTTQLAINEILQNFASSYNERNIEKILSLFAMDDDVSVFGTGSDEYRIGRKEIYKQILRDFTQSDSLTISIKNSSISSIGLVAWAHGKFELNAVSQNQSIQVEMRFSMIFENRSEHWLIQHAHFSVTQENQEEGYSFPNLNP